MVVCKALRIALTERRYRLKKRDVQKIGMKWTGQNSMQYGEQNARNAGAFQNAENAETWLATSPGNEQCPTVRVGVGRVVGRKK